MELEITLESEYQFTGFQISDIQAQFLFFLT